MKHLGLKLLRKDRALAFTRPIANISFESFVATFRKVLTKNYLAKNMAKTVRFKANFFILTFKNLLILNIQLRCIPASKIYPAAYFS